MITESQPEVNPRLARPDEYDCLLELWTSVFAQPNEVFTGTYASCPAENQFAYVVEKDGQLAASVQVFVLPIRGEAGEPVPVGCIANVSTRPEFRGRQYSTQILRSVIAELERRGCGWSFLFTGVPDFYARLGWKTMNGVNVVVTPREFNSQLSSHPADASFADSYKVGFSDIPLSIVRTESEWELKLPRRLVGKELWLTPDGNAYALVNHEDGDAILEEWAALDGSSDTYQTLLQAVSTAAFHSGASKLIIKAARNVAAQKAIDTLFPDLNYEPTGLGMVRPISDNWSMQRLEKMFSMPEARFSSLDGF